MKTLVLCYLVAVCLVCVINAGPVTEDENHTDNLVQPVKYNNMEDIMMEKLNVKCAHEDVNSCLILKGINYFNRLLKKSQIDIGDFEIIKTKTAALSSNGFLRSLEGSVSDEDQLTHLLMEKLLRFIQTRSLKWKVTEDADVVISGNNGEDGAFNIGLSLRPTKSTDGDARKKKDSGIGVLLAAVALKIGLLKALAFKALALLVGKALLVSKLALVLAVILGLKKLFSQEKHVIYDVVAHPHNEVHHEHSYSSGGHDSYGGWSRNFDGNKLAYRAHVPNQ
ncbi:Protein of unknown function (DUF1676) [Popillia japonica]|uniref:Osiris 7 n=1 Tax=Popillia japonica TaxID=7064 RepID=A0AAW1LX89_POPJA